MAEILLFHHAHGQTAGFLAFANELRAAGHVVHAPDLYDGKTFADLNDGVGYAQEVGFGTIARARSTRRRRLSERARLRRVLARGDAGADAGADSSRRQGSAAVLRCHPGLRVRRLLAAVSPASDPHDGRRRVGPGGSIRRA